MLNFLTLKECEALGVNPEERACGQLTIWFVRRGDKIEVQRVVPHVEVRKVEEALNDQLKPWIIRVIPEGERFVYHLGSPKWYVRDLTGEPMVWQRGFHDHARRALSHFITDLDNLLAQIDLMLDMLDWAKSQAKPLALRSVRESLFQRLPVHAVVICNCGKCPKPEKVTLSHIEATGYVPLYLFVNINCEDSHYRFVQEVVEAIATTVVNDELDCEKQVIVRKLMSEARALPYNEIEA